MTKNYSDEELILIVGREGEGMRTIPKQKYTAEEKEIYKQNKGLNYK